MNMPSGNKYIWHTFYRRMFPVLSFGVHSLNFTDLYTMEVEVMPSDNNRYKYVSVTGWRVNGVASQQEGWFFYFPITKFLNLPLVFRTRKII